MTLQLIRIVHVKGIQDKTFSLNIIPNKPSLLYAPNGFGKSSLAIAFNSLNNNRLNLDNDNLFEGNDANRPSLEVQYQRPDLTIANLVANDTSNTIKDEFDCFVINNKVRAKGTQLRFNGRTQVSTSLAVDPIVLINRIPNDIDMGYQVTSLRTGFGHNGKVLPNLDEYLNNSEFIAVFHERLRQMDQLGQLLNGRRIQAFKDRLNAQNGTTEVLLDWVDANESAGLDAMEPLRNLADKLMGLDLNLTRRSERQLVVLELLDLYSQDRTRFKASCERKLYLSEKSSYVESFKAFNSTWKDIKPKEKDGELVLEFPKAHHISNGQRDILCLVALLEVARRKLKKQASVLIIDEVFDYLDEGNLIAAQYYVSEFINDFKKAGRRIYPLILTHLNPGFFKNYSFSSMKSYYLDQRAATVGASFKKLVQNREHVSIEADVSKCLLHYHTEQINKRAEFEALGLRPTWGEGNNFQTFINAAAQEYLNDQAGYDPFAVCCAVRCRIEERVYLNIQGAAEQVTFLGIHGTGNKLIYAESIGINVPEYYHLLGIVYNDGLHWKTDRDNESPLKAKLENGTIRTLIASIVQ